MKMREYGHDGRSYLPWSARWGFEKKQPHYRQRNTTRCWSEVGVKAKGVYRIRIHKPWRPISSENMCIWQMRRQLPVQKPVHQEAGSILGVEGWCYRLGRLDNSGRKKMIVNQQNLHGLDVAYSTALTKHWRSWRQSIKTGNRCPKHTASTNYKWLGQIPQR